MKQVIILFSLLLPTVVLGQGVESTTARKLQERIENGKDTLFIVNFWATWCQPCVKELPLFDRSALPSSPAPIKVLLVSLDFKKQLKNRLIPFIEKNHIREEVLFMDESNPNTWMNIIDSEWSGAIPATKLYYKKKSILHEGELDDKLLSKLINEVSP